jgi:hypothetical protein
MSNGNNKSVQQMVNRRNTSTIFEVIEEQNQKLFDQQAQIDSLKAAITNLTGQLAEFRNMVNILKTSGTGHGATERNGSLC